MLASPDSTYTALEPAAAVCIPTVRKLLSHQTHSVPAPPDRLSLLRGGMKHLSHLPLLMERVMVGQATPWPGHVQHGLPLLGAPGSAPSIAVSGSLNQWWTLVYPRLMVPLPPSGHFLSKGSLGGIRYKDKSEEQAPGSGSGEKAAHKIYRRETRGPGNPI